MIALKEQKIIRRILEDVERERTQEMRRKYGGHQSDRISFEIGVSLDAVKLKLLQQGAILPLEEIEETGTQST